MSHSSETTAMRISIPLLIGLSCLLVSSAFCKQRKPASNPITSFEQDYTEVYGALEPGDSLLVQKTNLASDPLRSFLIVSSRNSCGANGCESVIYQTLPNNSYRRMAVITGSINPMNEIVNGYRKLEVVTHDPTARAGGRIEQYWIFQYLADEYVPLPSQNE